MTPRGLLAAAFALLVAACATPPAPSTSPVGAGGKSRVASASAPAAASAPAPRETARSEAVAKAVEPPAADASSAGTPTAADKVGDTRAAASRDDPDLVDRGIASWYGKKFHGRRTASGERYDMHAMTAAHKTLPFGTKVRVRSVVTGKEVVVRINDRGPYRHQRIIDLSQAAIASLGLKNRGVTTVELLRE